MQKGLFHCFYSSSGFLKFETMRRFPWIKTGCVNWKYRSFSYMTPQGVYLLGTVRFSDLAEVIFLENMSVHTRRNSRIAAAE